MGVEPKKPNRSEFQRYIDQQPYSVDLDGLRFTIDQDVFPPDMGKCSINLARIAQQYQARTALDMGCGSGYLALSMKRSGVPEVWASDIHGPDGGYEIARRFLLQSVERLNPDGVVIMAFSDREPARNSPDLVAAELGPGTAVITEPGSLISTQIPGFPEYSGSWGLPGCRS